ncbi:PREDICTED: cyclic AMP response element-binding protein B-like [Cyprinodon variegatus]|nr:PREDICTED: cyclic AMP response element-binding protein B-like [Cyprinodon variegatus]
MCYCSCGHIWQHGSWILVPDVPAQVNRAPYPTRPEPSIQVRQNTQQMAYCTDVLPLPNSSTATANVGLGDMSVERKTPMKTGSSEGPGIGCSMAVTGDEREAGDAPSEMGVGDLRIPTSEPGFQGNGSQTPLEDDLKKRERRRMKNREAARMCRRKKNEYVRCLENRLVELEEQKSSLIEEFKALQSRVTPQQRSGTAIL